MFSLKRRAFSAINRLVRAFSENPTLRYHIIFSYYFHPNPTELMLKQAFDYCKHARLQGDYLEFGVWKGRSFIAAFRIWKYVLAKATLPLSQMRFFAMDSFEGLPELTASQDKKTGEFTKGDYAYSETDFRKKLVHEGVAMDRIITVKGWFKDSLTEETKHRHALTSAAVVFIDCDLYESAVPVLEFITDILPDGAVVIFDDWFCFRGDPEAGVQLAMKQWLGRHPEITATEFQRFHWRGLSFLIHRRDEPSAT